MSAVIEAGGAAARPLDGRASRRGPRGTSRTAAPCTAGRGGPAPTRRGSPLWHLRQQVSDRRACRSCGSRCSAGRPRARRAPSRAAPARGAARAPRARAEHAEERHERRARGAGRGPSFEDPPEAVVPGDADVHGDAHDHQQREEAVERAPRPHERACPRACRPRSRARSAELLEKPFASSLVRASSTRNILSSRAAWCKPRGAGRAASSIHRGTRAWRGATHRRQREDRVRPHRARRTCTASPGSRRRPRRADRRGASGPAWHERVEVEATSPVTTTIARLTDVTVAIGVRSWNAEWKRTSGSRRGP